MMPKWETSENIHEQADAMYGGYEGHQTFAPRFEKRSDAQPLREERGEKVFSPRQNHRNLLRLSMFLIAMVMILLSAVLCIFFIGGTGGWVSMVVVAAVIFLITTVAMDKIE